MNVIYRISMVRDNCFVPRAMMSESNFQKCAPDPDGRSSSPLPLPPYPNTCREFPWGILDTDFAECKLQRSQDVSSAELSTNRSSSLTHLVCAIIPESDSPCRFPAFVWPLTAPDSDDGGTFYLPSSDRLNCQLAWRN